MYALKTDVICLLYVTFVENFRTKLTFNRICLQYSCILSYCELSFKEEEEIYQECVVLYGPEDVNP